MKPNNLLLHCYAEKSGEQWQVFCLDLSLAAQGDSFKEARIKLDSMVESYLQDALVGEDKEYADQLLNRKAPLRQWIKYYFFRLIFLIFSTKNRLPRLFKEAIPMVPCSHRHA
ncbi:MAG: hypothetical protein AWT59_1366 [Candidatus Gallionella acididurans]|uniref:DUF1902 domain-containing protein n=1 Tax=Candidatus Gallionella acididurans TaxID=1796491 RepID=A0A139BUG0_9PROT|nr:MAG: hypothetical protein AWT59_1366 [Candidatus Gallionella acididurans]